MWKMWVLVEQKKKLWSKWHFMEYKREIMQYVLKLQEIPLLPTYIKLISRAVLLCVLAFGNADI